MDNQFPRDITDPDKLDPTGAIEQGKPQNEPEEGRFATYMNQPDNEPYTKVGPQTAPSPIDLANQNKIGPSTPPSLSSIQAQMNATSSSLGDIKNQLHTKNLQLKASQKHLLRSKLGNANENIRGAAQQLGVDTGPPVDLKTRKNPITKFLQLVADGQQQLNSAATQVRNLDTSGKSINTGELLLVQVKLQKAQQELDYSSVILGKAVDIIKTLFNVQI